MKKTQERVQTLERVATLEGTCARCRYRGAAWKILGVYCCGLCARSLRDRLTEKLDR